MFRLSSRWRSAERGRILCACIRPLSLALSLPPHDVLLACLTGSASMFYRASCVCSCLYSSTESTHSTNVESLRFLRTAYRDFVVNATTALSTIAPGQRLLQGQILPTIPTEMVCDHAVWPGDSRAMISFTYLHLLTSGRHICILQRVSVQLVSQYPPSFAFERIRWLESGKAYVTSSS